MKENLDQNLKSDAMLATRELLKIANLQEGDILVVGCSSSEVAGEEIGTGSSLEAAKAVFDGISEVATEYKIALAAQCCEHLNRAIIVEKEVAKREHIAFVNVIPQPKAGGSFATTAYQSMTEPVAVEHIKAQAGMDIGDTLIGMHLQEVAVPVRISMQKIGEAHLVCARTRPKFIGGERAVYHREIQ